MKDNIHWGIIDAFGEIAIYPNLEYIAPLEIFKTWGNNDAVKVRGKYKGKMIGYIIDPMSKVNLPINFAFMPDFELEELPLHDKSVIKNPKNEKLYTDDNHIKDSLWRENEDWEDQRLDALKVMKVIIGILINKNRI